MDVITTHRGYKYRCYPTKTQIAAFRQMFGVRRFVWNQIHALTLGHERLSKAINNGKWKKKPNWQRLAKHINKRVVKRCPWISEHAKYTLVVSVARDYHEAWARCFAKTGGRPSFQSKWKSNSSFSDCVKTDGTGENRKRRNIFFKDKSGAPCFQYRRELGLIRYREHRPIKGEVLSYTVSETAGRFYVSFCVKLDIDKKQTTSQEDVGIDFGVTDFACLSNGDKLSLNLNNIQKLEAKKRHHQKRMAMFRGPDKRKGIEPSRRWLERKATIAKIEHQIQSIRRHQHHEMSRQLAKTYPRIVVEDLKIKNMTATAKGNAASPGKNVRQKAGLNKAILGQAWGQMKSQLKYKTEEYGGEVVEVNPAYTSQTCSQCGHVAAENRDRKHFLCCACGFEDDADVNAARNVLKRASADGPSTVLSAANAADKKGGCEARLGKMTRHPDQKTLGKQGSPTGYV